MKVVIYDEFCGNILDDVFTDDYHAELTESQWNNLKKYGFVRILDELHSQIFDGECYFIRIHEAY